MAAWRWGLLLGWPLWVCAAERPGAIAFQRTPLPEDTPLQLCAAYAEDAEGFLWFGTQDGLVRFDGGAFRVYRPRPGDPAALSGSYVRALLPARDGRLWVGTFSSGVAVFDPDRERFESLRHRPEDPSSLPHDRVEAIAEQAGGTLWFATGEGLAGRDPASGALHVYRHDPDDPASLAADTVRSLLVDRLDRLWVGGRGGLQRLDPVGRGFVRVGPPAGSPDTLADRFVVRLDQDAQGRVWVGSAEDGAWVLDAEGTLLQRLPHDPASPHGLSHYWVYGFAEGRGGERWVATFGGGIDVLDPQTLEVVERLRHDPSLPDSLPSDRIGCLGRDRSGLIWVGSWGNGLARHDPSTRAFRHWRHSPNQPQGPSHPAIVRTLAHADGSWWLGTNGNGIDIVDQEGRLLGGHRPDPASPGALSDGSVTALAQDPDGTVWVATLNGVLHRLAPGSGAFKRIDAAAGLPRGPARALLRGPDGALWVGSAEGLGRMGPDGAIRRYQHSADDPASLSGRAVEALAFTADGTLWVGTDQGLNAFDPATGQARRILPDPVQADGLPDAWVPDLMVAHDGRLWVATAAGAAILTDWDGRRARFDVLARRTALPAQPVESLIEDLAGRVWIGSRWRFDPASGALERFGIAEGNDLRQQFIASRTRGPNGVLLFGSADGVLRVDPAALQPWTLDPPVVVAAVHLDGRELPGASRLQALRLEPGWRELRIDYTAIDGSAPGRLRHRHRLEGDLAGWIELPPGVRGATLAGLAPGEWRLRMQASNRNGVYGSRERVLAITVLPAWYQTTAFRLGAVLIVLAALHLAWRWRLRQLRRRERLLERVVAERTAELAQALERIEQASLTDPLTGLRNRRYFDRALAADLAEAQRRRAAGRDDADLIVLLVDLDHFKSVNDQHGHAAGDAVLVQAATILRESLGADGHAVRWGGEEFLLMARWMRREDAATLAERCRAAVAAHAFGLPDGSTIRRTISIGYVAFPFHPGAPDRAPFELVLQAADMALYRAKRGGRNRHVGLSRVAGVDAGQALAAWLGDPDAALAAGLVREIC